MYPCKLCLLRVVQAAVVDALFCFVYYMKCCIFGVWTDMFKYIMPLIVCGFIAIFMRANFVTYLIYFCINPYFIFVFHILSLKMNPDFYLRAPRLPRFSRIETFEDLPSLYLLYYNEPPIPYATPEL